MTYGEDLPPIHNPCVILELLEHRPPVSHIVVGSEASFICSCRKKIGAELHVYLEEGTYHKRLFRGLNTDDMKK
jgi:hypothetical protein